MRPSLHLVALTSGLLLSGCSLLPGTNAPPPSSPVPSSVASVSLSAPSTPVARPSVVAPADGAPRGRLPAPSAREEPTTVPRGAAPGASITITARTPPVPRTGPAPTRGWGRMVRQVIPLDATHALVIDAGTGARSIVVR